MKYCEHCGKQLENGERCDCPAALEQAPKAAKSKKTILIAGAALLAVILIAAIIAGISVASKIDPFEYITVSFSGYNSNGTADISFPDGQMIEQIVGPEPSSVEDIQKWIANYDAISQGITWSHSSLENLSNGDEITVSVQTSGTASNKISSGEKVFVVSGLTEVETKDFFKDVSVSFEGISGEGIAELTNLSDDEAIKACAFVFDEAYGLSTGDFVTVSISNVDYLAETYSCIPTETTKTFTVPDLAEYVQNADVLPMDALRDIAIKYVSDSQEEDNSFFTYSETVYYKTFFYVPKEDAFLAENNRLEIFVVYEEYMQGELRRTIYTPLEFRNILQQADGSITLDYHEGFTSIFTTDIDDYINKQEEECSVTEVALDMS